MSTSIKRQMERAAAKATSAFAESQGADTGAANTTGPNGEARTGTYRPANPIEQMSADKEMTLHGFKDGAIQMLVVPALQFPGGAAEALGWRGRRIMQLLPVSQSCLVIQASVEDAIFYTFTLVTRQVPRNA